MSFLTNFTAVLAAPFVGCFAATATQRSLEGRDLIFERSHCDHCRRRLQTRDLVPILSWLSNRARCRFCAVGIPAFYPLMEMAFLIATLWATVAAYGDVQTLTAVFLAWLLLVLMAFDLLAFILPNPLTVSLMAAGLLAGAVDGPVSLEQRMVGLIAGGVSLLAVAFVYRHVRGRDGLGLGDVKLFAAAGAWVSLDGLPSVLFIGSALGLLYALVLFRGANRHSGAEKIPFGAGLCIGFWLTVLYGPFSLSAVTL